MHVIFRGDPLELARGEGLSRTSLPLWGLTFPMGVAVDVSSLSLEQQAKLSRNSHFEVVSDAAPAAEAAPAPMADAPAPEPEASAPSAPAKKATRSAKE